MGEKKKFPKPIIQNCIVAGSTVALFAISFHYIPLYDFSWRIVFIFIGLGVLFGFLSGLERMRYYRLQSEKDAMQASFGQMQFSLKRSAHQYRRLIDNLSDAIFQTNEHGRFVYFNQALMLMTGYSAVELKQMRLSNIQLRNPDQSNAETSILDNNIHRHTESWKNKSGVVFTVEINTRTIQSANRIYELHVARDVSERRESEQSNVLLKEIQHWHYGRIREESEFRHRFYRQVQNTLNGFSTLLSQYMKEYPRKDDQANQVLTDWKKTRNLLQLFISKNNRDMVARMTFWDVNEILLQELSYLKSSMDTGNVSIQVQFGANLLKTRMSGNDLTLAFGLLLRSVCYAIIDAGGGQLRVISNMTADSLYVEFVASKAKNYHLHFVKTLQMAADEPIIQLPKPDELPRILFSYMNLYYDSAVDKGKLMIKVRLPFERKILEQQPPVQPEKETKAKPPPNKSNDYVVL
ncbi:PAS domain S-box protein [bacterium]|nr:PAS domain S-box protein [bacterium]